MSWIGSRRRDADNLPVAPEIVARGLFGRATGRVGVATAGFPQLELEGLRTFIEVADAGGLSAAARRLGVSKSIVSRRVFRLEEALGALAHRQVLPFTCNWQGGAAL